MKKLFLFMFVIFVSAVSFSESITVDGEPRNTTVKPKDPVTKNSSANSSSLFSSDKNMEPQETVTSVFIIQNIATEKTRVYRRCRTSPGCPHELLMETDTLVGHSTKEQNDPNIFATKLGHFKIAKWTKFYEDSKKKFPAWYKSDYPVVPKGTSAKDWLSSKYLPDPLTNAYRGAYGWFAAHLSPNAGEQMIHGTYGWGIDKGNMLSYFRSSFVSFINDPMAMGATRVENQAVAYIRHLADVGTDVFRVYALEGYADASLARYAQHKNQNSFWDWVLTIRDAQKNSPSIDKTIQIKRNYIYSEMLEDGRFMIDRYPNGLGYTATLFGFGAGAGTTGNTYQIQRKQFQGVFLIDEGRLNGYQHPQSELLPIGGYPNRKLPAQLMSTSAFTLAEPAQTESHNTQMSTEN